MVMMAVRTPGYRLISELAVHAAERREEGRAGESEVSGIVLIKAIPYPSRVNTAS